MWTINPTVNRKQSWPSRPLATKNVQLVTESKVLQFQHRPPGESADKESDDETHMLKHAGHTTTALPKTLEFSRHSEFLVGTGHRCQAFRQR
jgi:hypothetical protein